MSTTSRRRSARGWSSHWRRRRPTTPDLGEVLGCTARDAQAAARELLANPHPVLRLAASAWHAVETDALQAWLAGLGPGVEVGPTPTQAQADAWASEHTGGLIDKFPVAVDDQTALVLASAVACAISWREHFHEAAASELTLPRAAGFDTVQHLLRTPKCVARQLIVESAAGPLAVHAMPSTDGDMLVVSVIADAAVDAADVLAHAHPIASAIARGRPVDERSLFDLPLGAGPSWTLTERRLDSARATSRCSPATCRPGRPSPSTSLLAMPALGFAEAGCGVDRAAAAATDDRLDAKQVALARYTRTGFQAAAVTGFAMRAAAMMQQREIKIRTRDARVHPPVRGGGRGPRRRSLGRPAAVLGLGGPRRRSRLRPPSGAGHDALTSSARARGGSVASTGGGGDGEVRDLLQVPGRDDQGADGQAQ